MIELLPDEEFIYKTGLKQGGPFKTRLVFKVSGLEEKFFVLETDPVPSPTNRLRPWRREYLIIVEPGLQIWPTPYGTCLAYYKGQMTLAEMMLSLANPFSDKLKENKYTQEQINEWKLNALLDLKAQDFAAKIKERRKKK